MLSTQKINIKSLLRGLTLFVLVLSLAYTVTPKSALADSCTTNTVKGNCIVKDINTIVDFLAAAVGIAVVGSIIYGAIQYILAGSDIASAGSGKPSAVAAARKRMVNGVIALLAFMFTYAFLQWVIPGGLFNQ